MRTSPTRVPRLHNSLVLQPGSATFTQAVPGDAEAASVSFVVVGGGFTDEDNSAKVLFPRVCRAGDPLCAEPAEATFHHELTVLPDRAMAEVRVDDGIRLCAAERVPTTGTTTAICR